MMKTRRTQYVTAMWTRAVTNCPADDLSPTDYGWYVDNTLLKPTWFEGPAIPDSLFTENSTQDMESEDDSDTESEADDELGESVRCRHMERIYRFRRGRRRLIAIDISFVGHNIRT